MNYQKLKEGKSLFFSYIVGEGALFLVLSYALWALIINTYFLPKGLEESTVALMANVYSLPALLGPMIAGASLFICNKSLYLLGYLTMVSAYMLSVRKSNLLHISIVLIAASTTFYKVIMQRALHGTEISQTKDTLKAKGKYSVALLLISSIATSFFLRRKILLGLKAIFMMLTIMGIVGFYRLIKEQKFCFYVEDTKNINLLTIREKVGVIVEISIVKMLSESIKFFSLFLIPLLLKSSVGKKKSLFIAIGLFFTRLFIMALLYFPRVVHLYIKAIAVVGLKEGVITLGAVSSLLVALIYNSNSFIVSKAFALVVFTSMLELLANLLCTQTLNALRISKSDYLKIYFYSSLLTLLSVQFSRFIHLNIVYSSYHFLFTICFLSINLLKTVLIYRLNIYK